jgi:hypothetical protein
LAINRFNGRGISVETLGGNTLAGNYIGTDAAGMLDRGNQSAGIFVNSGNNTIGGTGTGDRNLISGNDRQGIYLVGGAAQNNLVLGNWIGTNALGTGAVPNNQYGVWVASPNNRIGGTATGEGNVISGNRWGGVYVVGATVGGNVIQGNQVGTDAGGTAKLANDGSGVMISLAPNNTVGGSAAGAGNVLSGNAQQGVYVLGGTATGNVIAGNRIGTNAAGTAALGNSQNGVYLRGPTNRVGGKAAGEGNVISGNAQAGVAVFFADAASNVIEGNRIGTNAAGDAAVGNATYGVDLRLSPSALVGGTTAGAGNVISGNILAGVVIAGNTATGNQIQRNLIGTDFSGTADVGNVGSGILISSNASNNTIGGVNAGNVISGNNGRGIYFLGDAVQNNTVQGNLIGTDITGSTALANGNYGVWIAGKNNLIGGTVAGQGNVISGNLGGGIYLIQPWSGAPATGNRIEGNKIGVNLADAALGNQGAGVLLTVGAWGNTVGGAGAGNVIARNTRQGVYVIGATSVRNVISQNSIYQNGDQGIDLSPYGVAANDPDDADTGPNKLQNFPVMSSAVLSGGTTLTIGYSVPSATVNSLYPLAVEFFVADAAGQEGQTYLGGESYPAPGADSVVLTVGGVAAGQRIVATATDAQGNTSVSSRPVS